VFLLKTAKNSKKKKLVFFFLFYVLLRALRAIGVFFQGLHHLSPPQPLKIATSQDCSNHATILRVATLLSVDEFASIFIPIANQWIAEAHFIWHQSRGFKWASKTGRTQKTHAELESMLLSFRAKSDRGFNYTER